MLMQWWPYRRGLSFLCVVWTWDLTVNSLALQCTLDSWEMVSQLGVTTTCGLAGASRYCLIAFACPFFKGCYMWWYCLIFFVALTYQLYSVSLIPYFVRTSDVKFKISYDSTCVSTDSRQHLHAHCSIPPTYIWHVRWSVTTSVWEWRRVCHTSGTAKLATHLSTWRKNTKASTGRRTLSPFSKLLPCLRSALPFNNATLSYPSKWRQS